MPERVPCHSQVVEDEAGVALQPAHGGSDALVGAGADDADGEAAQPAGVHGSVSGADPAAVLVEGVVEDVVQGLDGPVAAIEFEDAFGVGGVGRVAGDAVGALDGGPAGLLVHDGAFDEEGLADVGEVQVAVESGGGPHGAALDAAVGEAGLLAEGGFAAVAEEELDVAEEGGLVGLGGEREVGAAASEMVREPALRQQGVGGEGDAVEVEVGVEIPEHGDDGADLVGTFGVVVGADREPVDFFWV